MPRMETKWPPHDPGLEVVTAMRLDRRDYAASTLRRPGARGVIIGHHDSHGLCYDVRHADGEVGCYDPDELSRVGEPLKKPS